MAKSNFGELKKEFKKGCNGVEGEWDSESHDDFGFSSCEVNGKKISLRRADGDIKAEVSEDSERIGAEVNNPSHVFFSGDDIVVGSGTEDWIGVSREGQISTKASYWFSLYLADEGQVRG